MSLHENNHAFIDAQNVHRGIRDRGWELDWSRLRIYLHEKYHVSKAYFFVGYMPEHESLYQSVKSAGFKLMYKPTVRISGGRTKGNVDLDLAVHALTTLDSYDGAVLLSSDGDFRALVNHWRNVGKLTCVISPHISTCSMLLRKAAAGTIVYLEEVRHKVEKRPLDD